MSNDTRDRMQELARAIEAIIPPGTGFAVLCFDSDRPGEGPRGALEYASNAKREDICRAMLEFVQKSAEHFGQHELQRLLTTQAEIDESEKEILMMALAESANTHPGHEAALAMLANKFDGMALFVKMKRIFRGPG